MLVSRPTDFFSVQARLWSIDRWWSLCSDPTRAARHEDDFATSSAFRNSKQTKKNRSVITQTSWQVATPDGANILRCIMSDEHVCVASGFCFRCKLATDDVICLFCKRLMLAFWISQLFRTRNPRAIVIEFVYQSANYRLMLWTIYSVVGLSLSVSNII